MAIETDLVKIGLHEKEALAYLSLLELGPASVVALSKKSGLKRTTLYEILESLGKRGLISETAFGRRTRFVAESPEKFFALKREELDTLRRLMPTLEALRNVAIEKPSLQFFHGRDGIEHVFSDMIRNTNPVHDKLLTIETKASTVMAQMGIQFFIDLMAEKKNRGLESLTLDTLSQEKLDEFAKEYPWGIDHGITIRILEDQKDEFNVGMYLYQNKIALVAADQLIAIVIENQRLKKSFEFIFMNLWNSSKETQYKVT